MKSTNFEIYNFLNITNRRLGKMYKLTGFCPLPKDFVVTKEKIAHQLFLAQMKNEEIFPPFAYEEKRKIKKNFKICLKNFKKIKKNCNISSFSDVFAQKFENYISLQIELLEIILKEFRSHTFDEIEAFREIYNLDVVFAQLLPNLFEENIKLEGSFENLEKEYEVLYLEKLQLVEKKKIKQEKKKKEIENNLQNLKKSEKNKEKLKNNSEKSAKNSKQIEKNAKIIQKIENKKDVEKTKQQIKS